MLKNKVLILMSTYNGEKYIIEQLNSIFQQTVDFDLLIRDDGSTDSTLELIQNYSKNRDNIKILIGNNIGCNRSYFELIKNAGEYKYYAFSDQDDIWDADKLKCAIHMIEDEKYEGPILYGSCSKIYKKNKVVGITKRENRKITFYNTIIQNILPGHSQVMNYDLFKLIFTDIMFDRIYIYDAWITNIAAVTGKIIFDNTPHTYYRMHDKNLFGFGENKILWVINRLKKLKNQEIYLYSKQIEYFFERYKKYMNKNEIKEIEKFKDGKTNILSRFKYICQSKLYRQSQCETIYFKILYLLNYY